MENGRRKISGNSSGDCFNLLNRIFNVPSMDQTATHQFQNSNHEEECEAFRYWLEQMRIILGEPVNIAITQSLRDDGVDLLLTFQKSKVKFGFQIKSYNDVNEKEFTKSTIAQISRSRKHRIYRLFIAVCADLTDDGQKEKIRGLTSEVSQMGDYCVIFSPEKTAKILKVYKEKQHPISQVEGLEQVMTMLGALQKKLGEDPNYQPEITLTYKMKDEVRAKLGDENRPIKVNLSLKYPKDKANKNFWDTLKEIQLTGKSATIPGENIEKFEAFLGDKRLIPEGTKPSFLTITPERLKLPPLTLEVVDPDNKTAISLEKILFERDAIEGTTVHISTHNNNLPYSMRMSFDADPKVNNKVGNFEISLSENADVGHVLKFERLLSALNKARKIDFKTLDGKVVFGGGFNGTIEQRDQGWLKLLQDLAFIQEKTATCIYLPDTEITDSDLDNIHYAHKLLQEGKFEGATLNFKIGYTKENAKVFLQKIKQNEALKNFVVNVNPIRVKIFGKVLTLGKGHYLIPEVVPVKETQLIEQAVEKLKDNESIGIEVRNSSACTVTVALDGPNLEKAQT